MTLDVEPGETVALRGILREVRNTSYAVPENSEFRLSITDPQGRLLSEQTVKAGRFGTFDSSLALPAGTANGTYVMAAHQERKGLEPLHFQGSFEVRSQPGTGTALRISLPLPAMVAA